jgi:hypothetical protein
VLLVGLDYTFTAVDRRVLSLLVGMAQEGDGDPDETDAQNDLQQVGVGEAGQQRPNDCKRHLSHGERPSHAPVDGPGSSVGRHAGGEPEDLGDEGGADGHLGREAKAEDE